MICAAVVGDGEGHQAFQADVVLAVRLQQFGSDAGKLHPFQDQAFLYAESQGHLGGGLPLVDQLGERLELIRRVHGQPDGVLGKAHFSRFLFRHDPARHGKISGQLALVLQFGGAPQGGGRQPRRDKRHRQRR